MKIWVKHSAHWLQERTEWVSGLRWRKIFSAFTAKAKFCYKLALVKRLRSPMPESYSLWSLPQVSSWSTDLRYADRKISRTVSVKAGFYCFHAFVWGWSFTTSQFISRHPEENVLWICIFHDWFLNSAHIGT